MRKALYILILLGWVAVLNGCTESLPQDEKEDKIQFEDFQNFPESPFIKLDFSQSVKDNQQDINQFDFVETDLLVYTRASDSTSIIFEDEESLNTFKIYLKSRFYLSKNQLLFDYLAGKSTAFSGDKTFAEMTFSSTKIPFSLTYFTTTEFIRLSYSKL